MSSAARLRGIEVCFASLTITDAALVSGAAALSAEERARAARFIHAADRRRFIASHAMLRAALSARTRIDAARIEIRSTPQGKPTLPDAHGVEFSLSRAGELAAFAFGRIPLGIDLVAASSAERLREAETEFCSQEERDAVAKLPPALQRDVLLTIWARKEALLKATGEGLSRSPAGVTVWRDAAHAVIPVAGIPWLVEDVAAPAGYRSALAHRLA